VGNLYGLGYRVGEPKTVRFESVPELLAVVNAPPTHYDVIDGEEIAVNQRTLRGYGSFTKLTNADGVSSNFEITRDTVTIESTASGVRCPAYHVCSSCSVDTRHTRHTPHLTERAGRQVGGSCGQAAPKRLGAQEAGSGLQPGRAGAPHSVA
jgi:hypothetical protein